MRKVGDISQITPFGMFIREYCRGSRNVPGERLLVSNLDYVVFDYGFQRVMLIEEKQSGGKVHFGQFNVFNTLDQILRQGCPLCKKTYAGMFVLTMADGCTIPGPGMTLNGVQVTVEQLIAHINFERLACAPLTSLNEYRSSGVMSG